MRCLSCISAILSAFFPLAASVSLQSSEFTRDSPCENWYSVLEDIQTNIFDHGQCNDFARQSIRITYHDAIGYSASLAKSGVFGGGGADGSLLKFSDTELADPANQGLQDIVLRLKAVSEGHNVSYGDTIQFAGAVGLSNCPGAPRLAFSAGRPEATAPAPPHLFPSPTGSVEDILSRFQDAGFSVEDTIALLGAHSIGKQRVLDPALAGLPLDSTPDVFDSQYHLEVLLNGSVYPRGEPPPGAARSSSTKTFRLASDAAFARHSLTACAWQSYIDHDDHLRTAFQQAMAKVAIVGQNPDNLVDCSVVIPVPPAQNATTRYPAGFGPRDAEHSCSQTPFPAVPQA